MPRHARKTVSFADTNQEIVISQDQDPFFAKNMYLNLSLIHI